jgi:hypothetical protein
MPGVLTDVADAAVLAGALRRAAAFFTCFLAEALRAGFLADAFLALDLLPDALRAGFLRLEALRFAFLLATVVPP